MTDRPFPLALREMRTIFSNRTVLVGTFGLGLILGISGPFDTLNVMPILPRIAYWVVVVVATFAIGSLITIFSLRLLRDQPSWLQLGLRIFAIGAAVTCLIIALNGALFDHWPSGWLETAEQFGVVVLISAVVTIGQHLIFKGRATEPGDAPLLARLAFEKRGALIALSAEDHYVRVATTKGNDMLLMRFSDAIAEIGKTPGLQIHRSHWVALDQISQISRRGDRGEVVLRDGQVLPISRTYLPAVQKAGLIPGKPRE